MKYIMISLLAAAADLLTKEAVKKKVPVGERRQVCGRLYLWHIKNKGLAYNRLEESQEKVMAASAAGVSVVAACLLYLIHSNAKPMEKIGPALILGGGLGNLIDRIKNKEVTDFIYIKAGNAPIFNFADVSALCGGVVTIVKSLI
ncbi:MAG: signal peptidase II [Candidatus Metalachnospira sp.]|nr:signal peptidase II [Candidatus Metalachnospira sp.]